MNSDDKKMKNFLARHDSTAKYNSPPNEWAQLNQEIQNKKSWWQKKPTLVAMATAASLAFILIINKPMSLKETEAFDTEVAEFLLDSYDMTYNDFEAPVDDYYGLLEP